MFGKALSEAFMSVTVVSENPLKSAKIRFIGRLFLFSEVIAQLALLLMLSARQPGLSTLTLIPLLLVAFTCGYCLLRHRALLSGMLRGFLTSTIGMLLLVVAFHAPHNAYWVMAGIMISGLGQGMVGRAVSGQERRYRALLLFSGAVLAVAFCLIVTSQFSGLKGFSCAFALLLDLSLSGAVITKITAAE
ncbi:hypothetical protein [uncultured Kosakonia sp.]|uniref:hypothetical protein n=1 Tax=uncultured Kosakonia sp. TaxID=1588927 RepID=UPI0025990EC0|nr:hypothetical protein [uncultured Kosakonia sp.]